MFDKGLKKVVILLVLPVALLLVYFFIYPLVVLVLNSFTVHGEATTVNYTNIIRNARYRVALVNSVVLSTAVTVVSVALSTILAFVLVRWHFPLKKLYIGLLTFPLTFPGVVVAFMIIVLFGNTGIVPNLFRLLFGHAWTAGLSYSLTGLFLAYLYFSLPRVTMTMIGSVEKLEIHLEEAARSLGASPARVLMHITLPALSPAFLSAGALSFATSISAFGTAFTLSANFNVLPVLMYSEFTLSFHIEAASAMAVTLGVISSLMIYVYRLVGTARFSRARAGARAA